VKREHKLFTETVNKRPLSADDDKRTILPDGVKTLAHAPQLLSKTWTQALAQRGELRETEGVLRVTKGAWRWKKGTDGGWHFFNTSSEMASKLSVPTYSPWCWFFFWQNL